MDMMMQYVKDVQAVQKKIAECVESIGFINEVRNSSQRNVCEQRVQLSVRCYVACFRDIFLHVSLLCYFQEEDLFKWENTTYPEIDTITKAIEPYQKLFSMVVKWQRAEKKWMDGAFQDLSAEAIEAEVIFQLMVILNIVTAM